MRLFKENTQYKCPALNFRSSGTILLTAEQAMIDVICIRRREVRYLNWSNGGARWIRHCEDSNDAAYHRYGGCN